MMHILDLVAEKGERNISYSSELLISFSYTTLPLTEGRANKKKYCKSVIAYGKIAVTYLRLVSLL